MKPHLRLLAVNVIKSNRVERIIRANKATFETVTLHDSKSIVCWRAHWDPASNFTFKLDGVRREASCQHGNTYQHQPYCGCVARRRQYVWNPAVR